MAIQIIRANNRLRNRLRLAALFILYPIYKTIAAIVDHDWTLAIIMGILVVIYAVVLLYIYGRFKRPVQAQPAQKSSPPNDSL